MKKALIFTLSYYFIQGLIHNLGHVITPRYVDVMGIPSFMFGFFFSAMSLGLLVGAPIWGILGDSRSKKPFIVLGLLGYSLGQVLFVSTTNLFWMTFFRFLSGFSVSASVTLFLAHIITLAPKAKRTSYLSISAALIALGTTFGYRIGGYLGTFYLQEVFYIQAVANAIYALFVWLTMREFGVFEVHKSESFFTHLKAATKMDRSLIAFLLALTLATMSATILTKYLDVYFTIDLGYSTNDLGVFVFITGLVGIFTNFVIVPFISRLKKDFFFMKWIQLASAIIVFIVFRSEAIFIALYTGYMIYIVLKSIYQPLEQNYISLNAEDNRYSTIMGVRQTFFALGMIIGPLLAGFIYDYQPRLVFDISAGLFIVAFMLMIMSQNALKKKDLKSPETSPQHLDPVEYKASL